MTALRATEPDAEPGAARDAAEVERMVEALLFAAAEPLSLADLVRRLPGGCAIEPALAALAKRYSGRGVELTCVAERWRFATAPDLAPLMTEQRADPRRLSKAAAETLAIVAYHQPVTRAEIEQIRGVQLSKGTLDILLELGWVKLRGRRRSPGRPVTFGTTDAFLEHYGLAALADLPGAQEMKAAGLADPEPGVGFALPSPGLAANDEEPLDPADAPEFHQDFVGEA